VAHWLTTPHQLPNPAFATSFVNIAYGAVKIEVGAVFITAGSAADLTGIGAVLGIPAQAWGVYLVTTGGFRVYRGVVQGNAAIDQPFVCKTPVHYLEDTLLHVAPFGNGITDLLGGLP
jgi:hypothetical protein